MSKSASKTPAPLVDRIFGSKKNKAGSASSAQKAKGITLNASIISGLTKKAREYNEKHPKSKVSVSTLKAVMRRGMGAYSTSHRPNITRNGWAYARVNKFLLKKGGAKVKAAYVQDDDLMAKGGVTGQAISCVNCNWHWNTNDSDPSDKYVCHKCGYDNRTYYDSEPIGKMADGGLISPNGKPSNLTPEQYKLVHTPEFKAWFGDWENDPKNASKVVDTNGEPLVVYHGTDEIFNEFSYKEINTKANFYDIIGFYFSAIKPQKRSSYGKITKPCFLNIRKEIIIPNQMVEKNPSWKTKPLTNEQILFLISDLEPTSNYYTKEKTIEILNIQDSIERQLIFIYQQYFSRKQKKDDIKLFFLNLTEKLGYDGAYMPHSEYIVAFYPEQIKLADGTNTTFDAANPDIRYEEGGGISWQDYQKTQFDEEINRDLPSDYFEPFEIKEVNIFDYPILLKNINGLEFRKWKFGGIGVFDGNKRVAFADNGAIEVAKDYQKRGIGLELVSLLKELNPNHKFGNMTPQGRNLMRTYYDKKIANKMEQGGETKFNDADLLKKYKSGKSIGFTATAHLKSKGLIARADGTKRKTLENGGLTKTFTIADIHKKYTELPKKYINAQLYIGMKAEMEHTKNPDVAKKIALDHLNESPFYYVYLTKMEKQLKGLDVKNKYKEVKNYAKGGEINPDNKGVKDYFAHGSGNVGGVLVGNRHSEGGIKAVNKSTNQPLEMEGGEVVITRNAVSDNEKREFEGEMLTNKEILSRINESGGGVSFADGGDIPESIYTSGKEYAYGGKMVKDHDIVNSCGCKNKMADGGKLLTDEFNEMYANKFNSGGQIYGQGGVVRIISKEVPTYISFQELFNGLKVPDLRKEYESFLKENYKINFTQLPQKVRTGLLLGSQKLIDNYINA